MKVVVLLKTKNLDKFAKVEIYLSYYICNFLFSFKCVNNYQSTVIDTLYIQVSVFNTIIVKTVFLVLTHHRTLPLFKQIKYNKNSGHEFQLLLIRKLQCFTFFWSVLKQNNLFNFFGLSPLNTF